MVQIPFLKIRLFDQLQGGVPPSSGGVGGQKTPEIDLSRAVHFENAQTFCPTPSELRERAAQSLLKMKKSRNSSHLKMI